MAVRDGRVILAFTSTKAVIEPMRATCLLLVCAALWLAGPAVFGAIEPVRPPVARIAFVVDATDPFASDVRALVRGELLSLARDEFDLRFPEHLVVTVDGPTAAADALERLLADGETALVVTQGLRASEIAARRGAWPKPVIAASVFDPHLQRFPETGGTSGVTNFTYIAPPAPGPVVRDLVRFRELASFTRVAVLLDEVAAATFAAFVGRLVETTSELGVVLEPVPVGATAASALDRLPADSEAVYLTPLTHLARAEFQRLAERLAARRLPTFSYSVDDVTAGIMASVGSVDLARIARRISLNAYRILLGDEAGTLPVTLVPSEELVLNMRTVREVGVEPPLDALIEARRLFETPEDVARQVTLKSAMEEAMSTNLALAIEDQEVLAGAEEVRMARANVLPTVGGAVTGTNVSEDVAASSFGLRPERNVDGELTVRQVLFSEDARANLSVQKSLQASRERDRAAVGLDVALEAAEAYLNVLRGKTLEQVQQDNLDLTLASLRLARERERIGSAGPGERLRLDSELARRRAARIDAFARRSAAEMSLNQVLNRPLDEPFATPESDFEGRALLAGSLATRYLANIDRATPLGDFLVEAAMGLAPEIQSLDAVIAAQERLLASTRRAFYLPTLALQGSVSTNLLREGLGSSPPPGLPAEMPDHPWMLGLSASLPIYQGSARSARRDRASAVLARLRLQRERLVRGIERNVRVQLQFAQASLAVVGETEAAARTASQSLELVTDAYGRGLANVVDLLEAQTSALLSERGVTDAVFDYLINLKRVERAVGRFEVLSTPQERVDFLARLREHGLDALRAADVHD